jgi:hypothetical protein
VLPVRLDVTVLRRAALGGVGLVALVALLGPAAPAAAAATPCVGVVVDGRLTGGSLRTACATGDPKTGLDALTRAGIGYAFVPRQPGQVCQLDGVPACTDTGADTYWSYWWRAKGSDRWVYATTGAGTHDPEPGDTEAWVWQDSGKVEPPDIAFARICPQAATPRSRTPTATAAPRSTSSGNAQPVPDLSSTPAASKPTEALSAEPTHTPRASSAPPPTTATATAAASTASTTAPSTTSSGPTSPTAGAAAADGGSGPPWAGLAVGAALVAGLGGAALVRARRGSP